MGVGILIGIVFVLQVHLIPDTNDICREAEEGRFCSSHFLRQQLIYFVKMSRIRYNSRIRKKYCDRDLTKSKNFETQLEIVPGSYVH
jgi:hypothetical protein